MQAKTHLSPVFKEVFAEDILLGVVMVKHLGKEAGSLLSLLRELHGLTIVGELDVGRETLVGRGKVRTLPRGEGWRARHQVDTLSLSLSLSLSQTHTLVLFIN